jgi:uncharacterized protein YndB with AHSA1/START domain
MSASSMPGPWLQDAPEIVTVVEIHRPVQEVFDRVSNPSLWHTWHPATQAVHGAPPRPLQVGESAIELIAAAGHRFEARWTVQRCDPPGLWAITTDTERGCSQIVYHLQATPAGCRFERRLRFRSHRLPWRWLDKTLTRWILQRQSSRALANLRQVAEAS